MLVVLYLLDCSYWTSHVAVACRRGLILASAASLAAALAMAAYNYAQAPPIMYMVLTPLFFAGMQRSVLKHRSHGSFLATLAVSLWVCAAAILGWFAYRVIDKGEWWTGSLKYKYQARIGCDPTHDCLASYLMWFNPCIASFVAFVFGTLCYLLSASAAKPQAGVSYEIRAFALVMGAVVLGLWIAVQVMGSASELSAVVVTFSMASLLIAGVVLGSTVGWTRVYEDLHAVPLFASLVAAATDWGLDVIKAVLISSPIVLLGGVYLGVSAVNQVVRRMGLGKAFETEEERRLWVTAATAAQLREVRGWRWTGILTTIHWWVIAVLSLMVLAGTFTVVFLSWVRVMLHGAPIIVTYVIFFLVGLTMFLNPFIPGLPVYLTGGIMLTDKPFLEAYGGSSEYPESYIIAITVAVFFCFGIKLVAVVLQQKGIGEQLGKRVWVRSLVNVNSVTMRAIRRILLTPGLSVAKVCILVGGPDWPVSVTTGILRCNVFQMLFGTLPVLFLIAPTVMAGAFMLKINQTSGDEICPALPPPPPPPPPIATVAHGQLAEGANPWESVSQVASVLTAFVQGAGLLAGLYYIEKVSAEHREALEAEAPDEEVLKIDQEKAASKDLYRRVSDWGRLPGAVKLLLGFSTVLITISFWAILIGPSFLPPETMIRDYVLTDCISVKLNGKFWTVVTMTGWFFLALCAVSCILLWLFGKWCKAAMAAGPDLSEGVDLEQARKVGSVGSSSNSSLAAEATGRKEATRVRPRRRGEVGDTGGGGSSHQSVEAVASTVFSKRSLAPSPAKPRVGAGAMLTRFAEEKLAGAKVRGYGPGRLKEYFQAELPRKTMGELIELRRAWSDRKSAGYGRFPDESHDQVLELIDAEIVRRKQGAGQLLMGAMHSPYP